MDENEGKINTLELEVNRHDVYSLRVHEILFLVGHIYLHWETRLNENGKKETVKNVMAFVVCSLCI